eukprot:jgi/Mesvir1/28892/Mv17985-RA.3
MLLLPTGHGQKNCDDCRCFYMRACCGSGNRDCMIVVLHFKYYCPALPFLSFIEKCALCKYEDSCNNCWWGKSKGAGLNIIIATGVQRVLPLMGCSDTDAVLDYIVKKDKGNGPLVLDLLCQGVCPRCCLRFLDVDPAGVAAVPSSPELFAALQTQVDANAHVEITQRDQPALPPGENTVSGQPRANGGGPAVVVTAVNGGTGEALDAGAGVDKDGSCAATATSGQHGDESKKNGREVVRDGEVEMKDDEDAMGQAHQEAPNGRGVCVACLGILQGVDGEPLQRLASAVRAHGHELQSFCLEACVPPLLLARQQSVWLYLQGRHGRVMGKRGAAKGNIVEIKDAFKRAAAQGLARELGVPYDKDAHVCVSFTFVHEASAEELRFMDKVYHKGNPPPGRQNKRQRGKDNAAGRREEDAGVPAGTISQAAVASALANMSREEFLATFPSPPTKLDAPCGMTMTCQRDPVFVGGRYRKLMRGLPHSKWTWEDDEDVAEDVRELGSVEEIIASVLVPAFRADGYKFGSSGREDIDVRMMGRGRPFLIEIVNARGVPGASCFPELEAAINALERAEGAVEVTHVQVVGKETCALIRDVGAAEKKKLYTAVVWSARPLSAEDVEKINACKDLMINQNTPIRVLHRRSPLVRPRLIHSMGACLVENNRHYLVLDLCTQAGTYVKEFIHGDLGRTSPNLGTLLQCETDILQLDVSDIELNFP